MIITQDFLESGMTGKAGITSAQLKLLGVGYPPMKGWKKRLIGTEIRDADAELFLSLKGVKGKEGTKAMQKGRRAIRRNELVEEPLKVPIDQTIKSHIKKTPMTIQGLNLLDGYLEKLIKGENLSYYEERNVKLIAENYRDSTRESLYKGFVYMIQNGRNDRGEAYIKIGYSKNPKERVKEIRTAAPKAKLIAYHAGSLKTEKMLHGKFATNRRAGEWFGFDMKIQDIIEMFKRAAQECSVEVNPAYARREELIKKWKIK